MLYIKRFVKHRRIVDDDDDDVDEHDKDSSHSEDESDRARKDFRKKYLEENHISVPLSIKKIISQCPSAFLGD